MDFIFLSIPVIFGVVSVYLSNKAVQRGCKRKKALYMQIASFCAVFIACFLCPMIASAAGDTEAVSEAAASSMGMGYIGAAIATGLSCIGGGIAVGYAAPAAIGATIYFGSAESTRQIEETTEAFELAHELGMVTILWCYLRNE